MTNGHVRHGQPALNTGIRMSTAKPIRLVEGCNYHTTWQSRRSMRFVLVFIDRDRNRVRLATRKTRKSFWCSIDDLIFIDTDYNERKADLFSKFDAPICCICIQPIKKDIPFSKVVEGYHPHDHMIGFICNECSSGRRKCR